MSVLSQEVLTLFRFFVLQHCSRCSLIVASVSSDTIAGKLCVRMLLVSCAFGVGRTNSLAAWGH